MMTTSRSTSVLLCIIFILIGLNLRPSMAAIGPLLNAIRDTIPLSYTVISLLTMLPVLAMGIAMFIGLRMTQAAGEHRVVSLSLLLIAVASLFRFIAEDEINLLMTAMIAGIGIAMIQSIIPQIIKSRFPKHIELFMGVYVTAIMGGAALSASTAPFLAEFFDSWQVALSIWAGLAVFALLIWHTMKERLQNSDHFTPRSSNRHSSTFQFTRHPRAWLLGMFFGLGTSAYTCVLAWLPPYYFDLGWQDKESGLILAFLTSMEVLAGLLIPAMASQSVDRRWILSCLLGSIIAGFIGLIIAPTAYALLWASLLGIGIGGLFPMSLIVTMDHVDDPTQTGKLTTFVQGIGYIIAAMSPLVAGFIKDTYSSFSVAWLILAIIATMMLFIGWRFKPVDYPLHFANAN
ncbi:cyanate transporter [Algicola sagamiensis]|uniref:cyanate transporter n=1 Tax=Algicola sagamiensis TaxID=163869 RepID=UPI00036DDA9A|nr:cyanate transporter [Algicola sagamiensis]